MRKLQNPRDSDFDRLIRGEAPSTPQDACLAAFVGRAKSVAATPPGESIERQHLSAILETAQLFVEKGNPVVRPASNAAVPDFQASGLPKRRRKFVLSSLFSTLTAKLAAVGVAVAMVSTGGLAAAGNLPARAQDAVSMAAEKVGLHIPGADEAEEESGDVSDSAVEDDSDPLDDEVTDPADDVTTSGNSSSDDVHAAIDATEPGPDRGKAVSEAARLKPAGSEGEADETTSGKSSSEDVHAAIDATEPGPDRGKAVSEAAKQKPAGTAEPDDDTGEDEEITP
jgi:hypothetical protein